MTATLQTRPLVREIRCIGFRVASVIGGGGFIELLSYKDGS